jgi:hypothetical protein
VLDHVYSVTLQLFCRVDSRVSFSYLQYIVDEALFILEVLPRYVKCDLQIFLCGWGSSVGIANGRSGDRIPVGARFSAPVHIGPGTHPASCVMGTGSFPGVESGRGVTLTPYPLLVPRSKNRVQLYLYCP